MVGSRQCQTLLTGEPSLDQSQSYGPEFKLAAVEGNCRSKKKKKGPESNQEETKVVKKVLKWSRSGKGRTRGLPRGRRVPTSSQILVESSVP